MVISEGAAEHRNVKRLVYLAAFMPDAGQSLNDLFALAPNPALAGALRIAPDRRSTLDPASVGPYFYNDCDEATISWANALLRPMLSESNDAVTAAAWRSAPSTYVVCTRDAAILPDLQRLMAKHADEVIEWDASHSPFASKPELVVELLERLARA
jgi:pimeloyl-ACP methyl ester carboxylesterase